MPRGRPAFPRWIVKPKDGILMAALTGKGAIEKARKQMGWDVPLEATQTYKY